LKNIDSHKFTLEENNIKEEFYRYLSFWPVFVISIIISITIAFFYLRYAEYQYVSNATIEILDKAQDSEMSLPTSMTVFNRSMINLENESSVLNSFSLHKNTVNFNNFNIRFYTVGLIKTSENHKSDWYANYDLKYKIDPKDIKHYRSYSFIIEDNNLIVNVYSNSDLLKSFNFPSLTTFNSTHDLPFDIKIENTLENKLDLERKLEFHTAENAAQRFRSLINVSAVGTDSDQINIGITHPNLTIANQYINTMISEFDKDGIIDKQFEYRNTIDFVDERSIILNNELKQIELKKQEFKELNNLSDIKSDANLIVAQQYNYNEELFKFKSQKDLIVLLEENLKKHPLKLMPANIGIDDEGINNLINEYNILIKERDRFMLSAGPKNLFLKNINNQLNDYMDNILISINNAKISLDLSISNIIDKENQYASLYKDIPQNEKILRAIERELEIKEKLFLLLLQKREEAAINFAVVKPSIKVIDYAKGSLIPVSPKRNIVLLGSLMIGMVIPTTLLFLWFFFDNKIHTKSQLIKLVANSPVVGEIPIITDPEQNEKIAAPESRDPLAESIRMIIANLNFVLFRDNNSRNNLILVTSSIKGEGKTLVSVNSASLLSKKFKKVLLIGADLRNPQIHKFLNLDKNILGLSDFIYRDDLDWKNIIVNHDNLDIIVSGTIPPNPTELLSCKKFNDFLNDVKSVYDYIVIDSAPCLLVSDTFEISKHVDTTLYVVRSNYTEAKLTDFINDSRNQGKLPGLSLVLNSVGASTAYGYKYGYQYGYQYGYNYGYGYGYSEDK